MSSADTRKMREVVSTEWALRRRLRMASVRPARAEIAASIAFLVDELLTSPGAPSLATHAFDRFRRSVKSTNMALWLLDESRATCVLVSGTTSPPVGATLDLAGAPTFLRRRHDATLICPAGDTSGLERFVATGSRSLVAALTHGATRAGLLVLGWNSDVPPCDRQQLTSLPTAASLLLSNVTRPQPTVENATRATTILSELPQRIVMIDRIGKVVATNPAWSHFWGRAVAPTDGAQPRFSYWDVCRRLTTNNVLATALFGKIRKVAGGAPAMETSTCCNVSGQEHWISLSVSPMRSGGALIVESEPAATKLAALTALVNEKRFQGLAETLSLPIWVIDADSRVLYHNGRWVDTAGSASSSCAGTDWLEQIHPDDVARVRTAFQHALGTHARCEVEARFSAPDGTFRWCAFVAEPQYDAQGRVDNYVGISWDISARRRAEVALNQVAAELVMAQEAERGRVARELHDDLGQQIALLSSRLDALMTPTRGTLQRLRAGVIDARRHLHDIAKTVHDLSHQLHPAKLALLGLSRAIEVLCRDASHQSGVAIAFKSDTIPTGLADPTALCLFRVAQEALQNAIKHSLAHHMTVQLVTNTSGVTLRVTDDGMGFDLLNSASSGLGLVTMRERVELAGGSLKIESSHGKGSHIEAVVPLHVTIASAH